jgi:hypothetical protein
MTTTPFGGADAQGDGFADRFVVDRDRFDGDRVVGPDRDRHGRQRDWADVELRRVQFDGRDAYRDVVGVAVEHRRREPRRETIDGDDRPRAAGVRGSLQPAGHDDVGEVDDVSLRTWVRNTASSGCRPHRPR